MLPQSFSDFGDSPIVLLSPHNYSFGAASRSAHSFRYHSFEPIMPPNPWSTTNQPSASSPIPIPSAAKKRTRDEAASPDKSDHTLPLPPSKTPGISPEPNFGAEMAPINPLTGQQPTAETQTGTWFESQLEKKLSSNLSENTVTPANVEGEQPRRKVQRCDTSPEVNVRDFANSSEPRKAVPRYPQMDKIKQALGVGWVVVVNELSFVPALFGFARYIQNHYPLTEITILLKNTGMDVYLVESSEGYFLFKEDLKEARLVASDLETAMTNIRGPQIIFESKDTLIAGNSPKLGPLAQEFLEIAQRNQRKKALLDEAMELDE